MYGIPWLEQEKHYQWKKPGEEQYKFNNLASIISSLLSFVPGRITSRINTSATIKSRLTAPNIILFLVKIFFLSFIISFILFFALIFLTRKYNLLNSLINERFFLILALLLLILSSLLALCFSIYLSVFSVL